MKVVGSASKHAVADVRDLRRPRFPLRVVLQRDAIATRKLLGHLKPDVVPRVLVLAAGIAKTNDQLHSERLIPNP